MNTNLIFQIVETVFSVEVMLALLIGVVGGIIIGSLPGLSATMAVAVLIPVTFGMNPVAGLAMLVSIYAGAIYGGSIAAILINTPGTPASAATGIDGYQMTLKGQGGKAIGIATISSVIGGFISGLALLFLAPPISKISVLFSAPEYFLIAVFGLTVIASVSSNSVVKGITAGIFGILIGTVGIDNLTGVSRFTFDFLSLQSGISFVPAMIGLFSISQVMILIEGNKRKEDQKKVNVKIDNSKVKFKDIYKMKGNILRSSGIGSLIGIMPGAGADIGSWISYNEAKRFSKKKEEFGNGSSEGIAAAESANNGTTGASLIPLLTLGIPGSGVAAVLLGGFLIQGLVPGRELFTTQAPITYSVIVAFLLANIVMGIIGLLGIRFFVKLFSVSKQLIIPIIVVLSVIGSYAINNSVFDVWIMTVFGLIGYILRKTGFHPAPIVLGMILGPIAELGFRQSLVMAKGDVLLYYFSRPFSVILIILIVGTVFLPLILKLLKKKKVCNQ